MKNLKQGSHRNDVVMTPKPLAKMIVEHFNPTGRILEPCKGEGNFLEYLPNAEDHQIIMGLKKHYLATNPSKYLLEVLDLMKERDALWEECNTLRHDVDQLENAIDIYRQWENAYDNTVQ